MVPRPRLLAAALLIVVGGTGAASCAAPDRPRQVDLLEELPGAEKRAGGDIETAVRPEIASLSGRVTPSLVMRVPARVTWPVELPVHAEFRTAAILSSGDGRDVQLRIGLSDDRTYEDVTRMAVTDSWQPLIVSLRRFSEWKFSLFYQPLFRPWRLVINAEGQPGAEVTLERPLLTGM